MGIYLPNMEMPNPGHIVLVEIDENGDVFAAYDGGRTKLTQHKAVPVPDHGDLIDRGELFPIYADLLDGGDVKAVVPKCVIDTAPTIIPADGGAE